MLLNAVALNTLLIDGTLVSPVSMPASDSSASANSSSTVIAYLYNTVNSQASSSSTSALGNVKVVATLASSSTNAITNSSGRLVVPVILTSYVPNNLCQGGSHALNTSMLNSTSTHSCVVSIYGNQIIGISHGKLLVQAKLVSGINPAISNSSGAVLKSSAYLKATVSSAVTKTYGGKLIERTLALEECRMMLVPEYLNTMRVTCY
jgi:hypothetical protein